MSPLNIWRGKGHIPSLSEYIELRNQAQVFKRHRIYIKTRSQRALCLACNIHVLDTDDCVWVSRSWATRSSSSSSVYSHMLLRIERETQTVIQRFSFIQNGVFFSLLKHNRLNLSTDYCNTKYYTYRSERFSVLLKYYFSCYLNLPFVIINRYWFVTSPQIVCAIRFRTKAQACEFSIKQTKWRHTSVKQSIVWRLFF